MIVPKWLLQTYMKYTLFTDKFFLLWCIHCKITWQTIYLPLSLSVEAVRSWKMAQMSENHLLLRRLTATVHVYEVWWKSLRERSVSLKSLVWLSDALSYDGWIDSAICFGAVSMVTVMPLQLKWSCCRTFLNGMCLPPLWSHFPSKNTQCGSIQDFWGRGGRLWCNWWTANVVE